MRFLTLIFEGMISLSALAAEHPSTQETRESATKIQHALEMFYTDCNEFPTTEQGLKALMVPPKDNCVNHWGPDSYMPREVPLDAWDRPFHYKRLGRSQFVLWSLGADNAEGGIGDAADVRLESHL